MQQDIYQPMLTVRESMQVAADLKLGHDLTKTEKLEAVSHVHSLIHSFSCPIIMNWNWVFFSVKITVEETFD